MRTKSEDKEKSDVLIEPIGGSAPVGLENKTSGLVETFTKFVEGGLEQVQTAIAALNPGEVPVNIVTDANPKRGVRGNSRYVVIVERRPNSFAKARLVFALGITAYNAELSKLVPGEKVVKTFSAETSKKRRSQNMFMAIVTKD